MATKITSPIPPPPPPPLSLPATNHRHALYVGDLHPDTTEDELYLLFSMIGPVSLVRICRDRLSFKSLGYGYVNFCVPSHAEEALTTLNHTELKGKPIRIMWSQRDPLMRKTGIANLFVKNLDSFVTDTKLEEVFGKFGRILSSKIAKDNQGKSKGFGFVQFDSEESANKALETLDGSLLEEKVISVAKFMKKSERKEPEFTNVYVKNLESDFTENLLKQKFSEYGNVTSAVIMKDDEGKSRGFGFVNFESTDSAKKAIEALNGAIIGSKELFVGKAMKKEDRQGLLKLSHQNDKTNASNLFVKNLATSVDEKTLGETFGHYGNVVFAKVIRHRDGISKGFGFVSFSDKEEAKRACDSLNGKFYHGKNMCVSVALSKEECAQNLQPPQYFNPYYGIESYGVMPVYDSRLQPNIYGGMPVCPSYKPQRYQGGKPLKTFKAFFSEAKEAHQNENEMKSCKGVWDMKKGKVQGSRKALLNVQVKGGNVVGY